MKPATDCLIRTIGLAALLVVCVTAARADPPDDRMEEATLLLQSIGETEVPTGILYDLVLPLSGIDRHDGSPTAAVVSLNGWRQMYHEIRRASLETELPGITEVLAGADESVREGAIPISVMNFKYNRIRPEILQGRVSDTRARGAAAQDHAPDLQGESPAPGMDALSEHLVFAAAALKDHTYRGGDVCFTLPPGWYRSNLPEQPAGAEVDFGDGRGFVTLRTGEHHHVSYSNTGRKTIRVRVTFADETAQYSSFSFDVLQLATPSPHDTLSITATIPYLGEYASGQAYLYYGVGHTSIENPVIVIEGFDIDNTMNWEVLYEALNQENMIEDLRALGFDAVVLDFTDATDYMQRNSFVAVELIEQVNAMLMPGADIAVVGASMGGLIGRYSLAYMEQNAIEHNVRTFISFDSPQKSANIPLGIQYWVKLFSIESAEADTMLQALARPAPRQMLAYYLTDPPGSTGEPDPLLGQFQADVAALGDYPADTWNVAVANGSGNMTNQGFAPGDQLIFYEYYSLLVDIIGNVWAVPDSSNHIILDGEINRIWPLPDDQLVVYVEDTDPFDGAPGGTRSTMADMDSLEAPYGDIIALHEKHCFIPTISALDLDTDELFYDIAGDPDLLLHTPFDTVYFPAVNEEHIEITPESKTWFINELQRGTLSGIGDRPVAGGTSLRLEVSPNPFSRTASIGYHLPSGQHVSLSVYDAAGRAIAEILDGHRTPGAHRAVWDGTDRRGRDVAPGTYFIRLRGEKASEITRVILLR
jgi:hypothetical protein